MGKIKRKTSQLTMRKQRQTVIQLMSTYICSQRQSLHLLRKLPDKSWLYRSPFPLLIFLKSEEAVLEISPEYMDTFIYYTRQRKTSQPARAINNRWLDWDYPVTGDQQAPGWQETNTFFLSMMSGVPELPTCSHWNKQRR